MYLQGIEAESYSFSGKLTGLEASLGVQIIFFKENGNLTVCDEEVSITDGNRTMKFNIDVSNVFYVLLNSINYIVMMH